MLNGHYDPAIAAYLLALRTGQKPDTKPDIPERWQDVTVQIEWDFTRSEGDAVFMEKSIEQRCQSNPELAELLAIEQPPTKKKPGRAKKKIQASEPPTTTDETSPVQGGGVQAEQFNCTDLGNAERFAARYRDTVRWCEVWNTWLVFNGKCWEPDKSGRVDQLAKATVRAIYHEAAEEPDDIRRKQLAKHAAASESNRAVRALLDRAKSELPATPGEFNTHLYLFNCENGTLDLRTGELRPHSSGDMLTRCIKYQYNPRARSALWKGFTEKFLVDPALIAFMQQALGMSLCGDASEQCLFICYGMGSNGKTTMLETARMIMGEYAHAANIETFQMKKTETINNDIAELYGARLVTAEETKLGGRLNEALVKKATGKQPLRARRLHENEFQFMPEFTLWLAVNHKPVILDTSKGMWRRVHFVPFNVTIDGDQVDKHFGEKLLEEAEGILAWLVEGCRQWINQGHLTIPQIVQEATTEYQREMDVVTNFLEDECNLSEGKKVTTKSLFARYEAWCLHNSERFDAKILKNSLKEKGFHSQRGTGGAYYWQGIELKPDSDNAEKSLFNQKFNQKSEGTSEGTFTSSSSKSEGSEGSEDKNRVNLKLKNPPDATLNFGSLPSLPSLPEHKTTQNSEGTFTQPEEKNDNEVHTSTLALLLERLDALVPSDELMLLNLAGGEKQEVRYSHYRRRILQHAQTDIRAAIQSVRAKIVLYAG